MVTPIPARLRAPERNSPSSWARTGGGPGGAQARKSTRCSSSAFARSARVPAEGRRSYVFGRGSEEALALAAAGLPLPGLRRHRARCGCGAYARTSSADPPATWPHAVTFVTAHVGGDRTSQTGSACRARPDAGRLHGRPASRAGRRCHAPPRSRTGTPAAVVIAGTTAGH